MSEVHEETFWEHLDDLRFTLIRVLLVVSVFAITAFCLKEWLFDVVLAPSSSRFFLFRWLGTEPFRLHLMNVGLTEQFSVHLKTAGFVGLLMASPMVLYECFRFISPALYAGERRYAVALVGSAYAMFMLGALLNYGLVFPLTVRFLGTYQVSPAVENMLTLSSYIDTFLSLSLLMGLVFELPVFCWLLGRMGLIHRRLMLRYRRHAVVAILVVAAIITPTTDAFTLLIVSLPIWLLYEASMWVVPRKSG